VRGRGCGCAVAVALGARLRSVRGCAVAVARSRLRSVRGFARCAVGRSRLRSVRGCGSVTVVDMGKSLSLHRGSFSAGGWLWYVGLVCLLAATSGFAGVGTAARQSFAERAPASFGALVMGLAFMVVPLVRWRQTIEIFERGLVWSRLHRAVRVAAEQVQEVSWLKHQTKRGAHDEVKLELTNGKRYSIVGVGNPEQLVNFLRSWARLRSGGTTASVVSQR